MLPDLNVNVLRDKLDKILDKHPMPLTILAVEMDIAFPTLSRFMNNKSRQRYHVLKKIAKFVMKYEAKPDESAQEIQ